VKVFLQEAVPEDDPIPGAVIAMQTLGDLIGHNPHCHILVTDGCFYGNKGMFRVAPPFELKKLDVIFQHKVKQPKSFCSTGRLTNPIHTFHHHRYHTPCFVVKILLTHKILLRIFLP